MQVWRVFESKCKNHEKAVYGKKQEYNVKRFDLSSKAADEFLTSQCRFLHITTTDQIYKELSKLRVEMASKHRINEKDIVTIAVANWTAPSTIKAGTLELQANMLNAVATQGEKGICLVLNPQFSYKKGQLYLAEKMVVNLLSKRSLDFDRKFGLVFKERTDQRDSRSLIYDGRVVVPFSVKESEYFFKDAGIMSGRTEPATMVRGSAMQCIEDVSETALPSTTDVDGTVKGAAKVSQIGMDGMLRLLESSMEGVTLDSRHAVIVWELNPGVGNLYDAFVQSRSGWNFPSYYVAMTDESSHLDWLTHSKKEMAAEMHLNGLLTVPTFNPLPEEIPATLLQDPPEVPQLSKLVAVKVLDGTQTVHKLAIPEHIIKMWATHPEYGEGFQNKLKEFYAEFGNYSPSSVVEPGATPKKRGTPVGDCSTGQKKATMV